MKDFSVFEKKIGVEFKNKDLLKTAFVHRSYLNENPSLGLDNNERLEFLGDAVLEMATTEFLYKKYPRKNEGEMTSLRAALVNAHILSSAARSIGMEDFLLLSKGEKKDTGKARHYILADTFEAVTGAIYLDRGYEAVCSFLDKFLFPKVDEIIEKKLWIDAKSLFQERAQDIEGTTPAYKLLKECGPDHAKKFTVGVFLNEEMAAEGEGCSKQEAEQNAAHAALEAKGWKH